MRTYQSKHKCSAIVNVSQEKPKLLHVKNYSLLKTNMFFKNKYVFIYNYFWYKKLTFARHDKGQWPSNIL